MPEGLGLPWFLQVGRDLLETIQDEVTGSIKNISTAIIDVWEMDCGGKWITYITTGTVAAGRSLYMLLVPSLEETLEEYLEPKSKRGPRGKKTPGDRQRRQVNKYAYRLFLRPPIPDPDDVTAAILPGRGLTKARRVAPGEWIIWSSINVADAVLWHWLLLEVTETFAVQWTSEMMESGDCQEQNDATAKFTTPRTHMAQAEHPWANKNGLTGLFEENISVGNNGQVNLDLSTLEGSALIVCLVTCDAINIDVEKWGTWEIELTTSIYNKWGDLVDQKTTTNTVTAAPESTGTAIIDHAHLQKNFHRVTFDYGVKPIQHASNEGVHATMDCSIAVRNVHVV